MASADAAHLRAQKRASTDPERLERMARREETKAMTDEQKEAVEWLKEKADVRVYARTILAMLAEPRLPRPEDVPDEVLDKMSDAYSRSDMAGNLSRDMMRAALKVHRDHYTAPRVKDMWRVSYVDKWGKLHEHHFDTLEIATPNYLASANNVHYRDAKLSGPHQQEVPDDAR